MTDAKTVAKAAPGAVPISSLGPQELQNLRKNLASELEFITSQYGQLKSAMNRYGQSQEALGEFKEENADKKIFIPLTSSLYVPGTLSNVDKVLVDVGTNYFVEKEVKDAKTYIKTRMETLGKQLEQAQAAVADKKRMLDLVTQVLQDKVLSMQQQQKAALDKQQKVIT